METSSQIKLETQEIELISKNDGLEGHISENLDDSVNKDLEEHVGEYLKKRVCEGLEEHVSEENSRTEKDGRKGKPIPGFAREVILKVASVCEHEAKNNFSKYPLNAPTKRAAQYTGVSERTIQRIRNEDRKRKYSENEEESVGHNKKTEIKRDHPDEESNYNTMKRKSKKGQTIPNSARNVISKVIDICDQEHKNGGYMIPFICKSKRTALYTGVSQRTVQRIRNEDEKRNNTNEEKILITPGRQRKRATFNDKIDDFDFHSIRRLIDDLTLVKKAFPTCTSLHLAVKERINFPYSENTLHRLLHCKGYEWHKGQKGKRVLLEKPEIFRTRLDYLKKIKNYEEQGKFIIYLDEKWIGHNKEDTHFCKGIFGVKGGVCCSGRLVVLNEFSAMGFIRRAEKMFKPNVVNLEIKPDISTVEKWMKENLFPHIPSNSVIVMSTNLYKKEDSIPNEYSPKQTLVQFLRKKRLKYSPLQTHLDLHGIIKNYLSKLPYEWSGIDKLIENHGHTVLRLPSYMSEFNPIELAWADVKRYVRNKNPNGKLSFKLVKEITLEAIECLQNDTLQGYVYHVIQMEDYFWERRRLIQEHYDDVTNSSHTSFSESDTTDKTVLPNVSLSANTNINNGSSLLRDYLHKDGTATFINPPLPENSIITEHSDVNVTQNSYSSMLPPNQLGYNVKNVVTLVPDKSAVICENQGIDGGMIQAGPSYLNL